MAEKKILKSDVSEEDIFLYITESAKKSESVLDSYNKKLNETAKVIKMVADNADPSKLSGINAIIDAEKKLTKVKDEAIKTDKEKIEIQTKLEKLKQAQLDTDAKQLRNDKQKQQESDRLAKSDEKQAKAKKDLNSAYKQLEKSTRDLKNQSKEFGAQMLDLEKSGRKNTAEYRQLAHQYSAVTRAAQQGDAQLKKLDKTVGDNFRNVGNYQSALGGLNNILAQVGLGFSGGILVQDLANTEINLTRMRTALQNVVTDQKEYGESLKFINDLSLKYGQDLQVLTQTYTSFIASAKSSNLPLSEQNKIYQSVVKSAGALGLSNEQLEGSLLAVSQMFSKGKVSAEELRGQLGERLPGAFGLMAKALNVSEAELNDMLQKGQVLASDALPKLANELEKTYGAKAENNLKTLGGAFNVLKTEISNSISEINKGGRVTEFLASNLGTLFTILGKLTRAFIAYKAVQLSILAVEKARAFSIKDFGARMLATIPFTKQYAAAQQQAAAAATQAGVSATNAGRAMMAVPWMAIIGILFEVGKAFWDIASGAKEAREASEMFEKQTEAAAKRAEQASSKRSENLQKQLREIERQREQGKISDKEELAQKKALIDEENKYIRTRISGLNTRKAEVKSQKEQIESAKAWNNILEFTDSSEKERYASMLRSLGLVNSEIYEFNGAIAQSAQDKALNILKTKTAVLNEELKVMHNDLSMSGEMLKDATSATKAQGKETEKTTKAQKDYNTEFKRTNELISEQSKLLNELKKIRTERFEIEREKEIDSALRLEVHAIEQTGEINADGVEEMISVRYQAERQAIQEQTEFEIYELQKRHEREKAQRLQALQDERDNLLKGAKDNKDAQAKIEANYQLELKRLNSEELKREEDLNLENLVMKEKLKNDIIKVDEEEKKEISSANDEFIEAQIRYYDRQNEIAREAAKEQLEAEKKLAEQKKALAKEVRDTLELYGEQTIDREIERSRRRQEVLQREMSEIQRKEDMLREMAVAGNADAQKSLAVSEQLSLKKQQQIEREAKKQQALETAKIAYKAVFDFLEKGDSLPIATVKGATGAMTMQALFKSLFGFRKGTKRTVGEELNTKFSSGEDGYIARVDAREKILNPELSAMTGNATTDEIVHGFLRSQSGLAVQMPKVQVNQNNNELIGKIEELKHVIKNKKEIDFSVELRQGLARGLVATERTGINRTRTFYRR